MRERDIEAYLVKRVKAMGGEVRKVRWLDRRGAPDRVVMLPERNPLLGTAFNNLWWVELKATGKKAEPHQLREHARMKRVGQRVVVIDSLAGVEELLA